MARMKFICDAERCIECNGCVTACKAEHDVPWGVNRRRVVTLNDGVPGFKGLRVKALVTERVNAETVFLPFHFSGHWGGVDLLQYYPEGAHPVVRGEAANTATTYGYDSVTMMQETKTTVCQIERATAA